MPRAALLLALLALLGAAGGVEVEVPAAGGAGADPVAVARRLAALKAPEMAIDVLEKAPLTARTMPMLSYLLSAAGNCSRAAVVWGAVVEPPVTAEDAYSRLGKCLDTQACRACGAGPADELVDCIKRCTIDEDFGARFADAQGLLAMDRLDDLLRERSDAHGRVVMTSANLQYSDFLLNLVQSMHKVGVHNYFVVALDKDVYNFCRQRTLPVVAGAHDKAGFSFFGERRFNDITQIQFAIARAVIERGYELLMVDADIVFACNPFVDLVPPLRAGDEPPVDFYLQCESACLARHPFLNTGFFYLYPTAGAKQVLALTLERKSETASENCQTLLNHVLYNDRRVAGRVRHRMLSFLTAPNGIAFFVGQLPQLNGTEPVIVHNNYVRGRTNKRHRFREAGMWGVDPPSRADPAGRYLSYDTPADLVEWHDGHYDALYAALAVAAALGRTLILPRIYCHRRHDTGALIPCDVSLFVDMARLEKYREWDLRESSFLEAPLTPASIRDDVHTAHILTVGRSPVLGATSYFPADRTRGATDAELQEWFGHLANVTRIHFTAGLGHAFSHFVDPDRDEHMREIRRRALSKNSMNHDLKWLVFHEPNVGFCLDYPADGADLHHLELLAPAMDAAIAAGAPARAYLVDHHRRGSQATRWLRERGIEVLTAADVVQNKSRAAWFFQDRDDVFFRNLEQDFCAEQPAFVGRPGASHFSSFLDRERAARRESGIKGGV